MSLTVSQSVAVGGAQTASSDQSGLAYEMTTKPDPVRVSPATGALEKADIVIVGSHQGFNPIEIRRITVGFPIGDLSHALTEHLKEIEATVNHAGASWTPSHNEPEQEIVFNAPGGAVVVNPGQGVTIQLRNIPVNRQVGTVPLTVIVSWRRAGTSASYKDDIDLLPVGKFPPDFRLDNLRANPIALDHSGSTTLTWEASAGATYKLLYGTAEIDVTNVRTYTVNNLRQTTPFYLRGVAQSGNTTVERTLTTLVTVNMPDLEVTNLYVRGTLSTLRVSNLMCMNFTPQDGWSAPVPVSVHSGAKPPAVTVHNGRLHCVHRALIGDHLMWTASADGLDWLPDQTLDFRSPDTPALASFDSKLYCVFRGMDDRLAWSTYDGIRWSEPQPMEWSTTHAPAIATFEGKLYCVFRADDGRVLWTTYNGTSWSQATRVSTAISTGAAALAVGPGRTVGTQALHMVSHDPDGQWRQSQSPFTGISTIPYGVQPTSHGPAALATLGQTIYLVRRGEDGAYLRQYTQTTSSAWSTASPIVTNSTKDGAAMTVFNDKIYLFYMR
ncbi:hypothetical protein ACFRAR_04640 [Kitasatospora sp. NPDC056651]|uniref:hypothetical protein n=1 Tax=Kitasatospora sp. NPDC056651 TaxID=3345892 RepID=UPI00368BBD41